MTSDEPSPRSAAHIERDENVLARWSRRKSQAGDAGSGEPVGHEQEEEQPGMLAAPEPLAAPKTDADMPPVESLNADSDYAQFLSPGVSEPLRQAALRKLFHLPHFNVTDGLYDYAGDYREFTPLGDIVTADMRHRLEKLAEEKLMESDSERTARRDPAMQATADEGAPDVSPSPRSGTVPPDVSEPDARQKAASSGQRGKPVKRRRSRG